LPLGRRTSVAALLAIDLVLDALYRHRFQDEDLPRKRLIWEVICRDFLQKHIGTDAVVLDLACGYGEFINAIRARVKHAADLNPESPRYLDPEVIFHAASAQRLDGIASSMVDVVFASNVLEHLPDKAALSAVFNEVLRVLKPGGRFILLGPNIRYLPGTYWDFYDHHLPLTHLSLAEGLVIHGFTVDLLIDRFLPYTTKSRLPAHPLLISLYLRMPVAWRLLGKQFFAVARKTAAAPAQGKKVP
jgi:SAM-dependent methyltransferase